MKILKIDLENCYGIKKLSTELVFSEHKAYAIYAPNGAMKTSFAKTFSDIANEAGSKDLIFPDRVCKRKITDENNVDLDKDSVLVVRPYDDEIISHKKETSTLLVDNKLREEYENIHIDINKYKEFFLNALKKQSGSRKDLEKEISLAFTADDDSFFIALNRIWEEMQSQKEAPFADIKYDIVFDEKVLDFLKKSDVNKLIESYIRKYNELLEASTYFKKGIFNYYNAATIAKSLANNGFFDAKHTVNLNATDKIEITSEKQLEEIIRKEKEGISNDRVLRKKFDEIGTLLEKNKELRNFGAYLGDREDILPELSNIGKFKEKIWKSYFKAQFESYKVLVEKYKEAESRKNEIEEEAKKQQTQWESVIKIFNSRFFVPFKLIANNRINVILGQEPMLRLSFIFEDGEDHAPVEKNELMKVLSTGEKRAFYVLNIIFEIEVRKKKGQKTVIVIDDIADSFDYKNKYAIIQYLKDIAEEPYFNQIILTHNFDFFRTIHSRFVRYEHCLMASKNSEGITLTMAKGIKNIFVNDWKLYFYTDKKKKIASIPFIRNIIEYTKGEADSDYSKLTSLLHWKKVSNTITMDDLDSIFKSTFNTNGSSSNDRSLIMDVIQDEAKDCLDACTGINFENKIVLSIAIRIAAEKYMIHRIEDDPFVDSIVSNQTSELFNKFKELFPNDSNSIETIQRVILMTPENIHLNSFMYEPILDMSDEHLKKLYIDVSSLQ